MTATPFPLPRETRESAILIGNGTAGPYGPSAYKIFDTADVTVWTKPAGADVFTDVTASCTIAKVNPANAYDYFTVTFGANVPNTTSWYHQARRTAERSVAVTKGGTLIAAELEKELSKQASAGRELRRDVDRAVRVNAGEDPVTIVPGADGTLAKFEGGNLVEGPNADDIADDAAAAQAARDAARKWATEAEDVGVNDGVNPAGFSAFHWMRKALASTTSAAAYAAAASASAIAAAASAASINLPPIVANAFLQGNAGGTAYVTKTAVDVRDALDAPPYVADLAALAALDATKDKVAIVWNAADKNGAFAFSSSNLSARVTEDTLKAVYVAPASDATGASGAWVRQGDWAINGADARWGGYAADYSDTTGAGTENGAIIAFMLAISTVRHVRCPAGLAKMNGLVTPKNKMVSGVKPTLQTFLNGTVKPSTFTDGTVWCSRVAAVLGVSIGVVTSFGTGGTNGTFALAFTGGTGAGAAGTFTVAGGTITDISITNGGAYTVVPAFSFAASAGLTGANISTVLRPNNELVRLNQHSGLKDVMLFWDSQPTPAAAWTPSDTPWAVRAGRFTDSARNVRAEKAWMEGVTALAFSHAFEFQRGGEGGYIRDCKWQAFKIGLSLDGIHHIIMLDNVEAYPYWSVDSNVVLYMLDNYVAYEFGRIDGLRVKGGLFSIDANVGVGLIPSRSNDFTGQPAYFVDIDAIYSDSCTHGLMVYPSIVSVPVTGRIGHLIVQRTSVAGIGVVTASDYGVRLRGLCDLNIEKFEGSGSGFVRPGSHITAVVSGAKLTIGLARICQWDTDAQGKPAFSFGVAGTHLTVKHVDFHNGANYWAPGTLRVYQGVTATGEDNIDTGKRMYLDGVSTAANKAVTINSTDQTLLAWVAIKVVSAGFREFRVRARVGAHATLTNFTVKSAGNTGQITDTLALAVAGGTTDVDGNWKSINLAPTTEAEFGGLLANGVAGDASLTFTRLGVELR